MSLQTTPGQATPGESRRPSQADARTARRREAGYTLLELLVVLAILGLLVGLVAPQVMGLFASSKQKVTEQSIARLKTMLDMYRLDAGGYPTSEQGLVALLRQPAGAARWGGPYLDSPDVPLDPWGRPFQYRSPSQRPGRPYDLFSLGADGAPGGEGEAADIFNP